jgi:hypothetical protein
MELPAELPSAVSVVMQGVETRSVVVNAGDPGDAGKRPDAFPA